MVPAFINVQDLHYTIAGDTEQSIFDALQWSYKEPNKRKAPQWIINRHKKLAESK